MKWQIERDKDSDRATGSDILYILEGTICHLTFWSSTRNMHNIWAEISVKNVHSNKWTAYAKNEHWRKRWYYRQWKL